MKKRMLKLIAILTLTMFLFSLTVFANLTSFAAETQLQYLEEVEEEEPSETPEPTDEPEPSETPEPTDEPDPTDEPEPTDEPDPTEDPEPTDEPIIEPTEEPITEPVTDPKFTEVNKTMYSSSDGVNVRAEPSTEAERVGQLTQGEAVQVTATIAGSEWLRVTYNGSTAYILGSLLSDTMPSGGTNPKYPDTGLQPSPPPYSEGDEEEEPLTAPRNDFDEPNNNASDDDNNSGQALGTIDEQDPPSIPPVLIMVGAGIVIVGIGVATPFIVKSAKLRKIYRY